LSQSSKRFTSRGWVALNWCVYPTKLSHSSSEFLPIYEKKKKQWWVKEIDKKYYKGSLPGW
jgi:hypothetical protein